MTRPEWDQTFMEIAKIWSQRSTCSRRQVGAVVVKDNRVIGQGYNGVASGRTHCVDGGCPRGGMGPEVPPGSDYNRFPCYAIHAEHNAILQAGLATCVDADIYVTAKPCQQCLNLIEHAKIGRIVVLP
jgi:dCMP deaminase